MDPPPRYPPPLLPPPAEYYCNPAPQPPYHGVPRPRPPGPGWRGGASRPSMPVPYRHPHYRQQYTPRYGNRKRQGDFSNSYGSQRGQYGGRGRYQKRQRYDRNAAWSSEKQSGPNAYDPFYDQSMFEDPWKHLLPQEELTNTAGNSTSDFDSKPEDTGLVSDGSLLKPEDTGLVSEGSSLKPEDPELVSDGSSLKPEDTGLVSDGSSLKPEDPELVSDGSSLKPEDTGLVSDDGT